MKPATPEKRTSAFPSRKSINQKSEQKRKTQSLFPLLKLNFPKKCLKK